MGSQSEASNLRVLYVDDDRDLLELTKTFLEREDDGLSVETADGACPALERLEEREYDAIVSDYRMPEMDGLEFLDAVRDGYGDEIPFVIFTGQGREEVAMEALNLGANRYLQKGGDADSQYGVLARTIRQEVAHRRAEDARRETEKRYRSLFENNPLVLWVEDFSDIKAHIDEVISDVEDVESYLDDNPDEVRDHFDRLEIIDVNENALDYYGAESKRELLDNMGEMFTEESHEANKSLIADIARGKTHSRTESVVETLDGERKHEIMEVNVPDEYADDYSRVYVAVTEVTERVAAQRRESFLHSLMRHDVRNREQVVRGSLERLQEYDLPDDAAERVEQSLDALDESTEILDKVSSLVRTGHATDPTEEVEVRSHVESAVEGFEPRAAERGVSVSVTGDCPTVRAGPLLEELFRNLVGNALRHANATTVRISIRETDDRAVVAVEDDGAGVPDEQKGRVFEPRYKTGESAGAGLGLHLVGEIAEAYGGRVEVSDSDLGGAKFAVFLDRLDRD
ncbi:ATP-binding response regulator [Halorussus amylolyticus]|uniref:ATP-binding response regulator n=1 Tax=Halorussus amylolyticus TaxID=1126242 RepID=UPI00104BD751|nr:hybrid sensor histidine kinase/response regulator [Halorussus amylolyticus]